MPDDNFESWCENLGYGDGVLDNDTINTLTASQIPQLDLDNLGIVDLTGIESFTSATVINLANNPDLSIIDISSFGNNLTFFTATGCSPSLYCINVFDTAYAVSQSGYSIDSQTSYSTDCNAAFGCMDPLACNYNSTASIDTVIGGSCSFNVDTIFPAVDVCEVYVWPFNGMPITTSGTHSHTIQATSGCDSTGFIDVTIRNIAHSYDTTNTLICNSTIWNNLLIDVSGDYDYTFLNGAANGCDSVAHLHAIIEYSNTGSSTVTACDSFIWDGTIYTSSTIDSKTYTNSAGCDSVHTLNLTIDNSHTFTDVQQHCISYTWINGVTYFTSNNTDSFTYQTVVGGCDSIIFLDLTINDSTINTTTETACNSYNWPVNGTTYTASGTFTHISSDANNCVQVDTLHLTVNNSNGSTDNVIACNSYTWIDGNTYTASNSSATFTDTNVDGCDSIITLNLTVNYSSDTTDVDSTVCSFFVDALGNIYDTTAIYTYILTNGSGCDSVIRLDLTVDFPDSSLTTLAVCDSYTWNGIIYDSTGIYTFPTTTVLGCDSVAVLDLFVGYTETYIDTVEECDNYVWFDANGDTILTSTNTNVGLSGTVAGNYGLDGVFHDTIVYTNEGGCDSIRILHLTVNSSIISSSQAVDVFACDSWTNPYTGQVITTSGSQTVTTGVSPQGCDSLQWYNIYLTAEKRDDINVTACDTFTWIIANDLGGVDTMVYTSSIVDSMVYTGIENVYLNNNGDTVGTTICDSIVYLHLTINYTTSNTDVQEHCDSYTWTGPLGDGNTYTQSGVYAHVTQNASGCNHTEILDLTINYSNTSVDVQQHCASYTWINGVTYENLTSSTTNETDSFMLTTIAGCDSLVTLDLTLFPIYSIVLAPVIACDSFHWELSAGGTGVTYFSSGNYTSQFTSVDGCDSLIILDLTIDNSHTFTDVHVACDSFTWIDGNVYTSSNNTASFTYSTVVGGCDSTIFLDLTVNYSNTGQSSDTACDFYIWDLDTITAPGTFLYSKVYTNSVGCDSVHTLELTINNSNTGSTTLTACDNFTWDGSTYDTSGIYTKTYTNISGCDSVHTLNLTIDNTVVTHETVASCYTYVWTPWSYPNNTYTFDTSSTFNAGVNSLTYIVFGNAINTSVCTDTAFLHLTINPLEYGSAAVVACDSYLWEGNIYDTTGVYIDTIAGTYCDSIVTLDLTINYSDSTFISDIECDVYIWMDGNGDSVGTYYNSGTYYDTHTNISGCDSTVVLDLTINNSSLNQIFVTSCDSLVSGYWDNNGWVTQTYYASTSFTYPVPGGNSVGCDSLVEMHITINNSWIGNYNIVACNSYDFDGVTYTNDTVVTATLAGVNCDSIVTLNLTINTQNSSSIDNVGTHCDSYTWIDGVTYTSSNNTATMIYSAANGCDSVVTLNLMINNTVTHTDTHVACDVFIWSCDGGIYTSSNNSATYTYYGGAANGCDSIVTLDLTINNSNSGSSTVIACDYYVWDGSTYFNDTIVSKLYTNAAGCDSTHILNLTIDNNPGSISSQVACDSYTWIDGNTYYNDTIVDFIIVNSAGCDSTVILDLTINNSTSGTDSQVACGSYTWIDGVTYTTSNNTASWTYPAGSVNGCDSVVMLDLVITTQNYSTIDSVGTQCDSYTWIDGNTYTSSNNTATMVYSAVNGCDSIVRLHLVIVSSPTVLVVQNSNIFDVVINGGVAPYTYSWSGPITSTDPSIEPLVSGVYCVEVTDAIGCVSNNSCLTYSISSINEIPLSKFEIYPNPASDIVNLEFTTKRTSDYAIQILSVTGLEVYYEKLTHFNGNYKGVIDLSTYSNGTYLIQIVSGSNIVYRKLIKQ
tara:strand:+ start:4962 stop:10427 length:5466 start_codon:yes stop_codon:yes gene_type:complete